ncbi:GrpB family protein [Ornithinimicrobium cerasi]|uniref:GrpB domain, predicted nucleotidyltransferase, UPF0157 family n=1 Tax=Ornithinimicrobium cerasi TaxID=2248773 RepID=A0A285VI61_9MICO|nr:GrpB family protein [Ornithinimicrobium cerasi]SOC53762.1 GrpB domain, predicted nucleotidyltransferase, UPF0157 family [Ornithinimicrobium cerasi]
MDLVRSDDLQAEARRTRDVVAAELVALGVAGELELTGATSLPGALTRGDVDLHLRVPADLFDETVGLLRTAYPVASPTAWAATLAVFGIPGTLPTGLAVTPVGSEHDVRFVTGWRELRNRPELLEEYNRLKREASDEADYEERKSAFFTALGRAGTAYP